MRKAFSLIEVLVMVATLPLFLAMVGRVFMVMNRDIPRSSQLVLEQGTVLSVLDQIRRDVDHAKALPESYRGRSSDEGTLLIERSDGVVLFQVADGKVTRTLLGPGEGPPEPAGEWAIPNASIHWGLWDRGATAYAVEVHTHMLLKLQARSQRRLANTYVFFLVGFPREVAP